MATDNIARGLAGGVNGALKNTALARKKVTLLVLGQSAEQGPVLIDDITAYPNAFYSVRNPSFQPRRPAPVSARGGWWAKVYDQMWDWGYDLDIAIGAVGGASLLRHMCGFTQTRTNSTPYYQKRLPVGAPDRGDFGDILTGITGSTGRVWQVTTGRNRSAFSGPPFANPSGSSAYADFVSFEQSGGASGASAPNPTATAIGGTLADGTVTLTRLDETLYPTGESFYPGLPGINGGQPNFAFGGILGERSAGRGFDPLGIIQTAWELGNAGLGEERIVWFSQGQSDLGTGAVTYGRAVDILANFFLRRGWKVILGNTIYSGASAGSTSTNYDLQVTGVDNAVTDLTAYYPGKVFRGANLYSVLGSTGNMAAKSFTGAITGGNLLTITAELNGSQIEVGQRVFNGTTQVGVIASFGTGTGGTGTYNLTGATNTASTTLISVGNWMQYDGVHFNGRCVEESGGAAAISGSIKTVLPQRPVIA